LDFFLRFGRGRLALIRAATFLRRECEPLECCPPFFPLQTGHHNFALGCSSQYLSAILIFYEQRVIKSTMLYFFNCYELDNIHHFNIKDKHSSVYLRVEEGKWAIHSINVSNGIYFINNAKTFTSTKL
jgi:hypothetical protein